MVSLIDMTLGMILEMALSPIMMKLIKEENLYQFDQHFGENCELKIRFRKKMTTKIIDKINKIENSKTEFLKTI